MPIITPRLMSKPPQPTVDPKTGKPRIKGERIPSMDGLLKGVKPEIAGPSIMIECGSCGYGGLGDPWYGYFLLPETPENLKRTKQSGNTQCPSCGGVDCQAMRDVASGVARLNKDQLEAQVVLAEQENKELKRQIAELTATKARRPSRPELPE